MSTGDAAQRRGTVLVVEADPTVAGFARTVLEDAGYAAPVVHATSSDAVRVAVGQVEPDCLVLDSRRPLAAGDAWQDAAWTRTRQRAIPVLLLTASSQDAQEAREGKSERSHAAGIAAVLEHPLTPDDLLAAVARAIGSGAHYDRSDDAERARTAAMVAALAAAGARDIHAGTQREWASCSVGDALTLVYWSQRDGVYYVLRQTAEDGAMRQLGRFHDLDAAIALAAPP